MTDPDTLVRIAGEGLSAAINPLGAELHRLQDADGNDLLWDGDPAFWTGRAPILFPIVGAVSGGVIRVDGQEYPLAQHGFARRRTWDLVEQAPDAATFRLESNDETRAVYPFEFRLDMRFSIEGTRLSMVATLANPGTEPLLASFGYHPALRWPLPGGAARGAHRILFAEDEPAPIRRIDADALFRPDTLPSPVESRALQLDDALFEDGAIIFDRLASRSLRYGAPGGTTIGVEFPDMPLLGLWTKPGAGYICIEPWHGHADPVGFAGEFRQKPGILEIPPGINRIFTMRIDIRTETF
jgi:galactose mutarotase-like enzyme